MKKKISFELYEKPKQFFQDWVFDHRVSFKCLHKGLCPFTGAGLHKRGARLPGDDRWGACLPYLLLLRFFET